MTNDGAQHDPILDVDGLMSDLAREVAAHESADGIIPAFAEDFTGFSPRDAFTVTAAISSSTRPLVAPVINRGKGMAARAAEPMVAGLAEQVAAALAEIRMIMDDILEEQARLRDSVAALRRETPGVTDSQQETPRRP